MKLSDYVIRFLVRLGVKHVFLLPGGGAMHLVDSVGRCKEMEYVCNLHEQACAAAAEAYAQYANRLGVALVTTGPGGTNTLTGVAAAWLDSTPCLFLSGQVKRADMKGPRGVRQMGFQEINIVQIVSPITKYAVTITDSATVRYHLEKAIFLARNGRPGPVWIDTPLDVQAAQVDEDQLEGMDPSECDRPADQDELREKAVKAIELLNAAERPVILVGNGVRLANAIGSCRELCEVIQAPVLTTWKTIDFLDENHPLFAGRPGSVGQRGANFTLQNSDFLLTLGARLDYGQIGYSAAALARAARKVIVDCDPAEIAKLAFPVDLTVCADAGLFIRDLLSARGAIRPNDRSEWLGRALALKRKYPPVLPEYWQRRDYVDNYVLIDVLSEEMCAEDVLVPGSSGACSEITMQAFRVKEGMRIFNSEGLGPMGFAIPAAIGACLASGRRRTVSVDGDGGFHMNAQELETIRRLNLPIKFFVLNNNGYGSIRATQRNYFGGHLVASDPGSGLTLPNTLRIAAAYGIRTAQIKTHLGIRQGVREVLAAPGPVVCEVVISPDQLTMPRLSSAQRSDGTMVSKPLEDLWPFLDRDEFQKNMLIPTVEE